MNEYIMKYSKSADSWEESLPIGSGRLGACLFGRTDCEIVRTNNEEMWTGCEFCGDSKDAKEHLGEIRKLIFENRNREAGEIADKYLATKQGGEHSPEFGTFRNSGDILIQNNRENVFLQRSLNLRTGVAETVGEDYKITAFAPISTETAVIRIEGKNLDISLRYDEDGGGVVDDFEDIRNCVPFTPRKITKDLNKVFPCVTVEENGFFFYKKRELSASNAFSTCVSHNGESESLKDGLRIKNATVIDVFFAICTDMFEEEPLKRAKKLAKDSMNTGFEILLKEQEKKFSSLMTSAELCLESDEELRRLDTSKRLERVKNGEEDTGLTELFYNYGKYLLISSSAPESKLPANLQGIWTKSNTPPWSSDYHANINLQMNYWHAEMNGLGDCVEPLTDFILRLSENGRKTAQNVYGCRGWVAHHAINAWGCTSPSVKPSKAHGCFVAAGAWLCLHILEHYRYTNDREFIKKYYPVIKQSGEFFLDYLQPYNGYLVTCPSNSPENEYVNPVTGEKTSIYAGPYMDTEILTELFDGILEVAPVAGEDDMSFIEEVKEKRGKLPPLKIGRHGNICEWLEDYEECEVGHRHMSHLFALYPARRITDGELLKAARKTVERRLENGGGHTGWSRAWILCFYARLRDGKECGEQLKLMFKQSVFDNLFDRHPPFQIDGNFGVCAAISEMLLDPVTGKLLPALPPTWRNGEFKNFRIYGNKRVSCKWEDGKVTEYSVE